MYKGRGGGGVGKVYELISTIVNMTKILDKNTIDDT